MNESQGQILRTRHRRVKCRTSVQHSLIRQDQKRRQDEQWQRKKKTRCVLASPVKLLWIQLFVVDGIRSSSHSSLAHLSSDEPLLGAPVRDVMASGHLRLLGCCPTQCAESMDQLRFTGQKSDVKEEEEADEELAGIR
ncbi:hypothetical protein B296_00009661 [Ensete ventricosum]|uniref:Uncharacterized protein n=1 Tax=Ensete ventricosum TaxID=4639 RepID=A0A426ZIY7_ENSVE|nr:hypothetical protein B296_00009661 [Ensete ventricosum]